MNKLIPLLALLTVTSLQATPELKPEHVNPKKDAYPLTICLVSDEKLDSMGGPYIHKHEKREVQFCCKGCLKSFNKDPKTALNKLNVAAILQQLKSYPRKDCLVCLQPLVKDETVDHVHIDNKLYRLCCTTCELEFKKHPETYQKLLTRIMR